MRSLSHQVTRLKPSEAIRTLVVFCIFQVKDRMVTQRHEVSEDIWDITLESEVLNEEVWIGKVTHRMKQFENDLLKAMR